MADAAMQLNFLSGKKESLPIKKTNGTVYFTDEGQIYFDKNDQRILMSGMYNGMLANKKTFYNVATFTSTKYISEIVIKTKIPFISSHLMPVIYIKGYAYGKSSPVDLQIVFYVYGDKFINYGAISKGAWRPPQINLSTYTDNDTKYIAVSLVLPYDPEKNTARQGIYYPRLTMDFTDIGFNDRDYASGWTVESIDRDRTDSIVPQDDIVIVPYKNLDTTAECAHCDDLGNIITQTYATKTELTNVSGTVTEILGKYVAGPNSATVGHIPVFNNVNGKVVRNSGYAIDPAAAANTVPARDSLGFIHVGTPQSETVIGNNLTAAVNYAYVKIMDSELRKLIRSRDNVLATPSGDLNNYDTKTIIPLTVDTPNQDNMPIGFTKPGIILTVGEPNVFKIQLGVDNTGALFQRSNYTSTWSSWNSNKVTILDLTQE